MVDHAGVGLSFTKACLRQSFHSVHHVDSCASTSALAKEWGTRGERHGSIFVASQQTQGRGRQGRSWFTYEGGLAFSIYLKPRALKPIDATGYTFLAGAALLEASSTFRATYSKWPNDILIERGSDQFGKLAGILVEATSSDGVMTGLVVGVGFNVCTPVHGFPDFLPWASSLELDGPAAIDAFTKTLAHAVSDWLIPENAAEKLPKALEVLKKKSVMVGKRITVTEPGSRLSGEFEGFSEDGALLIRPKSGTIERVITGDVSFDGYEQHA